MVKIALSLKEHASGMKHTTEFLVGGVPRSVTRHARKRSGTLRVTLPSGVIEKVSEPIEGDKKLKSEWVTDDYTDVHVSAG